MRAMRVLTAVAVTALLAMGLAACGDDDNDDEGAAATTAAPAGVEVTLSPQNDSGLSGVAQLEEIEGGRTRVTITLQGGDDGPARPAHVHEGTCANLNPAPAYPLTNVAGGTSETVIDATVDQLRSGTFAINLHRSVDDLETYVACGDIG